MASNKYCVIMAGGIGSRFWPKSRQSMPKQFLDILGTGKSFIRHTYERFAKIVPAENFLVVTNHKYKDLVLEHIPEIGERQVLCEPIGRNTAPFSAYSAYTLMIQNPDAEMRRQVPAQLFSTDAVELFVNDLVVVWTIIGSDFAGKKKQALFQQTLDCHTGVPVMLENVGHDGICDLVTDLIGMTNADLNTGNNLTHVLSSLSCITKQAAFAHAHK